LQRVLIAAQMEDRVQNSLTEAAMLQQLMLQQQLLNPMLGLGAFGMSGLSSKDTAAMAAFNPLMGLLTPSMALAQLQALLSLDPNAALAAAAATSTTPTQTSNTASSKSRGSGSRLNALVDKLSASQSTPPSTSSS
jgi:hypothetical protein